MLDIIGERSVGFFSLYFFKTSEKFDFLKSLLEFFRFCCEILKIILKIIKADTSSVVKQFFFHQLNTGTGT